MGAVRHLASLTSPTAIAWGRAGLERNGIQRLERMAGAARDRASQAARPTRPRMRALVARPGGRVAWKDVPVPRDPGPDGAIVHPIAVATCDLDRRLATGTTPFVMPLCFGHECVAEVVSVGERVREVRPGQRVVVPFQISCGRCPPCRTGHTASCLSVPPGSMYGFGFGGGHWGGAVADLLAVPFADGMLVALPDGVAPACAASVADNVADAFRHVEPHLPALLERDPEAGLLIVSGIDRRPASPPSIALYAGIIAVALGARDVRFADRRAHVRAHAERLGLQAITPSQLPRASPAQLVIDVSGTGGLRAALRATAPDGVCSSAGGLLHSVRLPVARMYASNVTLHLGRTHARAVIPKVLALIADGRLRPETVTTHEASIDDAPAAIHAHLAGQDIKTVLVAA